MQAVRPDNPTPKRPDQFNPPAFPEPLFLVQKVGETVQEFRARALQEINALPKTAADEPPAPRKRVAKKSASPSPPAPASE